MCDNDAEPTVNFISFNQTGSCMSMGTSTGFKIYNAHPFAKLYSLTDGESSDNSKKLSLVARYPYRSGSYSVVEMLFCTSLLAVVGTGDQPALSPRRLTILNTKKGNVICEVTFPTSILSVKMNKSRLVVLLKEQIYIYDITTMKLLHTIETTSNSEGIMSVSSDGKNYLAYPSPPKVINSEIISNATTNNITISSSNLHIKTTKPNNGGDDVDIPPEEREQAREDYVASMRGEEYLGNSNGPSVTNTSAVPHTIMKNGDVILFDMEMLQPTMVIEAHQSNIAALALSADGQYLATASQKGTIIRVFNTETGTKLYQFRRGTYPATVFSMSFSQDNVFLTVSCSTKTVHIFKLGSTGEEEVEVNATQDTNTSLDMDHAERNSNDMSSMDSNGSRTEPYEDASRKTVGRMIRKSSLQISRQAAKKFSQIFPSTVKSILEPTRHFASLKLPTNENVAENNNNNRISTQTHQAKTKNISFLGEPIQLDKSQYPSVFTETESATPLQVLPVRILTSEGYYYNYILDPQRGGDCLLLSQYSLLND